MTQTTEDAAWWNRHHERREALEAAAKALGYDCNCRRATDKDCKTVGCSAAQCIAHERTMLRATSP